MGKITEKRKEIEMDLIKVLRDFDDEELYKITIKYAKMRHHGNLASVVFFLFVGRVALEGVVGVENHDALDGLLGGSERDGRCCGRSRCRRCRCST